MTFDSPASLRGRWKRLVVDGLVIVGSILLAFAIDAWWDTSRDAAAARSRLALLAEQNTANREGLAAAVKRLSHAEAAMEVLVQAIGPRPEPLPRDSLVTLLLVSFSYGDFDVELSAAEEILNSGRLDTAQWRTLYERLLAFRAASGYYRDNFERLLERRQDAAAYLVGNAASGSLLSSAIGDTTLFPVPVGKLLADPRLEGLLAILKVRAATTRYRAQHLVTISDSIGALLTRSRAF